MKPDRQTTLCWLPASLEVDNPRRCILPWKHSGECWDGFLKWQRSNLFNEETQKLLKDRDGWKATSERLAQELCEWKAKAQAWEPFFCDDCHKDAHKFGYQPYPDSKR